MHALLFALFFLFSKNSFFSSSHDVDKSKIRVVGKAIRVDVVAMPKMTIQELKKYDEAPGDINIKPPEPKKVENTGGDENTVFKKEVKKASFADMLKDLSSRETTKSKAKPVARKNEEQAGAGGISGDKLKKIMSLGNRISEGSALYGNGGENSGDELDKYALSITDLVRRNWSLPGFLSNKDLSCQIQVFISKTGKLIKTNIIKSSGNTDYDQRALNAILKVGNFPAPSEVIANQISTGQIALGFPL
ncbi:TolA C-terminal domain protein [Bacteriovorax sp. Seq25_V]|nr:TolA C-terminal domain protein [Bacteriovorax sp. Seq25_V]